MGLFRRHRDGGGAAGGTLTAAVGGPVAGTQQAGGVEGCPNPVPVSWMAQPTLAESAGQAPLAGTSHYQEAIAALAGPRRAGGPTNQVVTVQLVEVVDGPYAGGEACFVGGQRVGSLRHGLAEEYRPLLAELAGRGLAAMCRAAVYGGGESSDGTGARLNYGVGLYQPSHPKLAAPDAPFLPPCIGWRVALAEGMAERLDAGLNSAAKSKVRRTTGVLHAGDWALSVDGEIVGTLEAPSWPGERRYLEEAAAAGFPLTCAVRVIRETGRPLRVCADVPSWGP